MSTIAPPFRQCGKYDLKLPVLGMGCWTYGGGEYWGPQSQKDVNEVVRFAVDQGCNFFDTAEAYNSGASEASLGLALEGIRRDQVLIGTKISPSNTQPNRLKEHCDASLRRLRTDYVDLYIEELNSATRPLLEKLGPSFDYYENPANDRTG